MGMHPVTLCVTSRGPTARHVGEAERLGLRYHAERGNDHECGAWERSETAAASWTAGPASAGKPFVCGARLICFKRFLILMFLRKKPKHHQSRLGCRLNAGLAQWAERHGCRESRPPPWMADGGGPTEQDRSEGTPTKEGPNQEQAPLVTWGAFPSHSPKAKPEALRPTLLLLG